MNLKVILVILVLIFVLIGGWWIYDMYFQEKSSTNLPWEITPKISESLIYPDSILVSLGKHDEFTFVKYTTYDGRAAASNFYKANLQKLGWTKIAELSKDEMTECGGDWGGTYEKGGKKFKLHICGFLNKGYLTDIMFYFYNIEPEQILGNDLSGGTFTCVTEDIKIKLINACSTNDTLKITIDSNRPEINRFSVWIEAERYNDGKEVEATIDNSGKKLIEIKYDLEKYGKINKVEITPIPVINGKTYECSAKTMQSEVKRCNEKD